MTSRADSLAFALSYAGFYGRPFEDFLAMAASEGFSHVQLIPDQQPNLVREFQPVRRRALGELAQKLGIVLHFHNVFYDINLLSIVPEVREAAFGITRAVLEFARDVDGQSLTVHPGYMFTGWRRDPVQRAGFWRLAPHALARLLDLQSSFAVPILLENGSYHLCTAIGQSRAPLHLGILPEELEQLMQLCDMQLWITLDIGKALQSGRPVSEFIEKVGGRVRQVQLTSLDGREEDVISALSLLGRSGEMPLFVLEGGHEAAMRTRDRLAKAVG